MAEGAGFSSNFPDGVSDLLFQTLADWNEQLKDAGFEFPAISFTKARGP